MSSTSPLQQHQQATLAELGEALARCRDELRWTTDELRVAQAETADALRTMAAAEHRAEELAAELVAVRESATWRAGRVVVGPVAWVRRQFK